MVNIQSVLRQELEKISLSKSEITELEKHAAEVVGKVPNARIGGSLAKGTLVRKKPQDIDIFIVFKNEKETKKLEGILKKAKLKARVRHGSRDYFQVIKENVIIEIIPVVATKKPWEAENVTDVSLMHVDYIKKKIRQNKKLADEIKLAKTFCYACDCYGAESYIKGFSGYALEVLVAYFGSFVKFLKGVGKRSSKDDSGEPRVIDSEKQFKLDRDVLQEINASKLQSPLVVVDPTYKFRNITAGLSEETFQRFLAYSKKFLKSPSVKAFERKKFDISVFEKLAKKKKSRLIKLKITTDRQEGDIAGTKMKKFFDFLLWSLNKKEQQVLDKKFVYLGQGQEAQGYIVVLPKKIIEVGGVDRGLAEAVRNFKKVRKKTYVRNKKVYAKEKVDVNKVLKKADLVRVEMGAGLVGF
tara:strand:+ start:432 stop:1670 length:1239 start_codon:yes stop_codon:yes gene_type:complete